MSEPTFTLKGNKIFIGDRMVGWWTKLANRKKVYISPRNKIGITKSGKGHRMEIFDSFGIAKDVLEFLERNHFDEIHFKIGQAETLISTLEDWQKFSWEYQKPPFEKQMMLQISHMKSRKLSLSEIMGA